MCVHNTAVRKLTSLSFDMKQSLNEATDTIYPLRLIGHGLTPQSAVVPAA
jgi:hypothetical protein